MAELSYREMVQQGALAAMTALIQTRTYEGYENEESALAKDALQFGMALAKEYKALKGG